jgi:hypothetical protein
MVTAAASGAGSRSKAQIEIPTIDHRQLNQMATWTRRLTSLAIMQTRSSKRFSQRSQRAESPLTELELKGQQQPQSPTRKRRRKTEVVEPVVYDIPPVESKTTTYQGLVS